MSYALTIQRRALKQLAALPQADQTRIAPSVAALATTPRAAGCRKLVDRPGWRIRVGDYRVIYQIDDAALTVNVVAIVHRRDAYR